MLRAASRDDSRPVLTGVLVEFADGVLTMAATDSYRMAVRTTKLDGGPPEQLTAIVPARALSDLIRISAALPRRGQLEIVVEENQVLFGTADVWLGARRIEGQFPEFRRLLPDTFEHEVSLPRAEFADVIARVEVLAGALAAAARVRAGRADGLGADARRSARAASRCPATSAASRSRSASTPRSCARASRASRATPSC